VQLVTELYLDRCARDLPLPEPPASVVPIYESSSWTSKEEYETSYSPADYHFHAHVMMTIAGKHGAFVDEVQWLAYRPRVIVQLRE